MSSDKKTFWRLVTHVGVWPNIIGYSVEEVAPRRLKQIMLKRFQETATKYEKNKVLINYDAAIIAFNTSD